MGFILAVYSIHAQYLGALQCFTIVFSPIGTALGVVLGVAVKKSEKENTGEKGGVNYIKALNEYGGDTI